MTRAITDPTPGPHTATIAVLVPSRGRPGNIARLSNAIMATSTYPVDVYVRVDDDDPHRDAYLAMSESGAGAIPGWNAADAYPRVNVAVGPRLRLAASWNELARAIAPRYPYLALWGDDVVPETPGWDTFLTDRLDQYGPGWAYGRDGVWDHTYGRDIPGQLLLPTATVMSSELAIALGYVSPPGLTHLCIDVAWRDLGLEGGGLQFVQDVMIRHHHPCAGRAELDAVYRDANSVTRQREDNTAFAEWRRSDAFTWAVRQVGRVRSEAARA